MQITNKYNLPVSLYEALKKKSYKPSPDKISVTELIDSPRIKYLKMLHWENIEEDASERLWRLLGDAVHKILCDIDIEDAFIEEKIEIEVDGFKLIGKSDVYHQSVITDWKITSVYSFLLGLKKEWENQLNTYAFLFRRIGFDVNKLEINAILRDWTNSKVSGDYPPIPFLTVEVPLWNMQKQEEYIKYRLRLHAEAEKYMCSDDERWKRNTVFAVKKINTKKALKLFDTEEEAENYRNNLQFKTEIEIREGRYIRCENFCVVRNFCDFAKEIQNAV